MIEQVSEGFLKTLYRISIDSQDIDDYIWRYNRLGYVKSRKTELIDNIKWLLNLEQLSEFGISDLNKYVKELIDILSKEE